MAQISTALKDELLTGNSFRSAMEGGYIHIYGFRNSTTIPDPDEDIQLAGTQGNDDYRLLATISVNGQGGGLGFESQSDGGVLLKKGDETWSGQVVSDGVREAAFFVHVDSSGDDGERLDSGNGQLRIVGSIGYAGEDLNFSSIDMVENETQEITYYAVTIG